ncbi:aminotransferase class I/II-fold pyridoxal phosphate-dependent enzyme [Caldanaerobius polysaccharolyticus]|uniref:aminotransferase class I/II-fold pyridoxal phosphate-dependent enzyme n=1 Tax=Caldanaerobius polysaccharolyticus TaxID=44256 RepID=UPI00047948F8|nr:aminotransferase class I/II-fold pyridoxal phosphate-dependent enzyme [Caldanaerobius polysaccharolyticus]
MYKLDQTRTPLFDALLKYYENNTVPFHVPGHKKGAGMHDKFKKFTGTNVLSIDVTVFKEVDSLHKPTGAIKEAQELAADAFGADATFFCIHGTTGAIQAMILSTVKEGDKIIIPRNVHKSVTSGIILSGATPVYIKPEIDDRLGIAMGVTPAAVKKAISENPDAKAVLIINPTYYGAATDIKTIADIVHQNNMLLLVDEAHGPHLKFNEKLPLCALDAGADMSSQSTHKILGAMTQGSMLHVRNTVDINRVKAVMSLLQTTSPSYVILASLDVARMQMATEGKALLDRTIGLAQYARKAINRMRGLYCPGEELIGRNGIYDFDPTKVTINARELGITGYQLERLLSEKYHVQLELADMYNALAVFSIGDTKKSVDALLHALEEISESYYKKGTKKFTCRDIPDIPEQLLNPREAFASDTALLPLKDSVGQISSEFILSYPPGIPVLCPGEIITQEIVDYVEEMKAAGLFVQGTEDPDVNYIKVVRDLKAINITA